jgi:hypothetical protein
MNDNQQDPKPAGQAAETNERREALKRLGKYSAYVAPFTVLAFTKKASAATGHGPGRHK